jgi:hypothetical protein
MKNKKVARGQSPASFGGLSAVLKPVRTYREVANLMGISVTLVCQLESRALSKVTKAIKNYDNYKNDELNEPCQQMED